MQHRLFKYNEFCKNIVSREKFTVYRPCILDNGIFTLNLRDDEFKDKYIESIKVNIEEKDRRAIKSLENLKKYAGQNFKIVVGELNVIDSHIYRFGDEILPGEFFLLNKCLSQHPVNLCIGDISIDSPIKPLCQFKIDIECCSFNKEFDMTLLTSYVSQEIRKVTMNCLTVGSGMGGLMIDGYTPRENFDRIMSGRFKDGIYFA